MNTERDFYLWLGGFLDGEGCFSLTRAKSGAMFSARIQLSLRCDDWRLIEEIWETTGVGVTSLKRTEGTNPQATWWVLRSHDCQAIGQKLADAGGIRSKKARDFQLWREAVDLLCEVGGSAFGPAEPRLQQIKDELHAIKKFDPVFAAGYERLLNHRPQGIPNPHRRMHYPKLSLAIVEEVVRLHEAGGSTQKELAKQFGVGEMAISRIVNGQYRKVGASMRAQAERLTLEQIDTMVARYRAGEKPKVLQEEYGCSGPQFYRYANGNFERKRFRAS